MNMVRLEAEESIMSLKANFVTIWCIGEVLCKGKFSHLQWKLNPPFAHNQEGPSHDPFEFGMFFTTPYEIHFNSLPKT